MRCPNCGALMDYRRERQDTGKFLTSVGCLGCLVSPLGCLLAPLAFLLPVKEYYACPACGREEPAGKH